MALRKISTFAWFFLGGWTAILLLRLVEGKADAFLQLQHFSSVLPFDFWKLFTHLGDGLFALLLGLALWLFQFRLAAFTLLLSWASSGIVVQLLKNTLFAGAERPAAWFASQHVTLSLPHNWIPYLSGSFPSGHSATAVCVGLGLALLAKNNRWMQILAAVLSLGLMVSRVALFQHFPEDILAGAAIASVLLLPSWLAASALEKKYFLRTE
jgi:membrane-associated phospholipid phosphatase